MNKKGGIPPREHQFKKGETGNPKGRPKSPNGKRKSAFDVIAQPAMVIQMGDVSMAVSAEEALQLKTFQQAINGDKKAWAEVLDMIIEREKTLDAMLPRPKGPDMMKEVGDPDNAFAAMVLLGIAASCRRSRASQWMSHRGSSRTRKRKVVCWACACRSTMKMPRSPGA